MSKKRKFRFSDLTLLIIAAIIIIPTVYIGFNKDNYNFNLKRLSKKNKNQCKSGNFLEDLDRSMITSGREYDDVIEYLKTKTGIYGQANHIMKKDGGSKYHIYIFSDKSSIQFEFQKKENNNKFELFQVTAME